MSKNLAQVFAANPITSIGGSDLMYVVTGGTTDAGINGTNFLNQVLKIHVSVPGASQTIAVNTNYIANNAGLVTFTLPATAAFGSSFGIQGAGAGGWIIAQNANQILHVGSSPSTTGVLGSVASSNRYDSVIFTCIVANLEWACFGGPQGNLTIA